MALVSELSPTALPGPVYSFVAKDEAVVSAGTPLIVLTREQFRPGMDTTDYFAPGMASRGRDLNWLLLSWQQWISMDWAQWNRLGYRGGGVWDLGNRTEEFFPGVEAADWRPG